MESKEKSSYTRIFKATSLFGGLQVYQILISIIRSKFIAVVLGPMGIGFADLYTSATAMIKSLSSFGLQNSAVRDIATAHASGDQMKIDRTITTLRKLVWLTGSIGLFIVLFGSPFLSMSTFGNYDYTIPFSFLSLTLLFEQLAVGQNVILQGTRRLKHLAESSALGSTIGLLVTIPLYYLFGIEGIVPTLIIYSVISYLLARHYAKKVSYTKIKMSIPETIKEGGTMLKIGLAMSINGVLLTVSAYLLRVFIASQGGADIVGIYTAGSTILTTYVGMVFSAISTDYFPRLSAVNKDNSLCREVINQQGEIGIIILAPCLIACVLFIPIIIRILYSDTFEESAVYVFWATIGMSFKLYSWVISFLFIAKSDMKTFLCNEFLVMIYSLAMNIAGYNMDGVRGLGIAFSLSYLVYALQVWFIASRKYCYKPSKEYLCIFIVQTLFITVSMISTLIIGDIYKYVVGCIFLIASSIYSFFKLNERINLKELMLRRK